jgi:hypothetical protein
MTLECGSFRGKKARPTWLLLDRCCTYWNAGCSHEAPDMAAAKAVAEVQFELDEVQSDRIIVQELVVGVVRAG